MSRLLLVVLTMVLAVCSQGCRQSAELPPPDNSLQIDPVHGHLLRAQPRLRALKVWLGDQELLAEVARRPVEIATGMMFRTNMTDAEGMLFVFPDAEKRSFYMRNCSVALSAAYMDPSGQILETINMQPHDETGIPSASDNVQFVLEVPQGWFDRHNVRAGMVVRTEHGTLQQTFFRN
jgi:uncharacterized protein